MRTSSMKSRTAVTTLVITLTLAVPRVDAKPAQPQKGTTRGAVAAVTQMIQRYFGITSNGLPGDPIPVVKPTSLETTSPKSTLRP